MDIALLYSTQPSFLFLCAVATIFGLCIGSFLNVCIHRLPIEGLSIVSPPSSCPSCGNKIRFHDNIPVIGWFALLGKCRDCGEKISFRYPMVELMVGLFALTVFLQFGITISAAVHFVFICALIVITFIDIDHYIIPDEISLPGIPIFFAASFFISEVSWIESGIGILVGGGSLWLVAVIYMGLTKKEGMGGGDIKLLAMIGALIGYKGVLFTIFAGSFAGTAAGLLSMGIKGLKSKIPFGPFLALGAILYIFYGDYLIQLYFNLFVYKPY